MVLVMIFWAKDYGPMRKSAELSKEGKLYNFSYGEAPGEMDREELLMKPNAKAIGMLSRSSCLSSQRQPPPARPWEPLPEALR